jgi:alkylation response protein AidB-like acyl-CoA dehydrogenase
VSSLLLSRRDLDFLLYEWLNVEELTKRPYHADHSRSTFDAALDLSEQVATRHFATHNKKIDAQEPTFDGARVQMIPEVAEALAVFADTGLLAAAMPYEVGGSQLPSVLARACFA